VLQISNPGCYYLSSEGGHRVKKFWRGFRKETDRNAREDKARIKTEQLKQLRHLLEIGGHEAESEYCQLLKDWKADMTKDELAERIRLFHAAVSARQSRD
jgi:hypothetical protein